MPITKKELLELLKTGLPGANVHLTDLVGDEDHYHVCVIWDHFKGKTTVQQHQMVYRSLQGRMGTVLHALSVETREE
jgi:stress-induced morphogen